jgi:arabinose operon protein AraL
MITKIEGYIFDLDGTIYTGERALPGAVELVAKLRQRGKKILFVSNNLWSRARPMHIN